ncbi:hypothetical protein [Mucilaginibacter agri]|uniref:Uncharacterized protein n=1 Tax=Mucilaginibacter agri TaxID=2695265 RepID=A0A965ZFU8_9SPHI|nr:hypothetical protein [Mucilaginibacter agri]NCD68901.1 hypothetical protein [Mucilaginibacter agri]
MAMIYKTILLLSIWMIDLEGNNEKACKVFNDNLTIIKQRIKHDKNVNAAKVNGAIMFFEELTSINSQSTGNYYGRFYPTTSDYNNWMKWYKKNRQNLIWDDKLDRVRLKPKFTTCSKSSARDPEETIIRN